MQTISLCMLKNCLYILMFHNTTKEWHAPRIVWTPAQVQTILGTFHHLVIIFSENKGFYVALPTMVQITWFFLHYVLSVTRSLICFRSLKSPISALNIDTGFLGFFSDFLIVFTLLTILGNAHRPCLHLLSLHNNLTTKVYIVQKKPCDLDHNWQSYIETFIFAKNDD